MSELTQPLAGRWRAIILGFVADEEAMGLLAAGFLLSGALVIGLGPEAKGVSFRRAITPP